MLARTDDTKGGDVGPAATELDRQLVLFKQFSDNDSFRRWLTDTVFGLTYPE